MMEQEEQKVDLSNKNIEELKSNIENAERELMRSLPRNLKENYDKMLWILKDEGLMFNDNVQGVMAYLQELIISIDDLPNKLKLINSMIREIANVKR